MQTTLEDLTAETSVEGWKRAAQRALHPSGRRVEADVLAAIAAGLATVTVPWELRDGEVPTERRYQRVLATAEYEAWVICWPSGGSLDLHDHGGSAGAFSVVSGALDEATIEATTEGNAAVVRRFTTGETSAFGSARVHAVANRGTTPATSVHVYSPPLSSMIYYEHHETTGLVAIAEDLGGWSLPASEFDH
jgi:Cysteine dioxygenase type I